MDELNEAKKRRLKKKKLRMIRDILIMALVVVLTAVNTYFGAINYRAISEKKQQNVIMTPQESSSESAETEPPEIQTEPENSETEEPQTLESETEPEETKSLLEQDQRYIDLISQFENPGILMGESSYTNIRKEPSLESICVGKAMRYCVFNIVGTEGDWYLIESDGHKGYLYKSLVTTGKEAIIYAIEHCRLYAFAPKLGTAVYFTPTASKKNELHYMNMEKRYLVEDHLGDWLKVYINPDYSGYSRTKDVDLKYMSEQPVFYNEDGTVSKVREDIINFAFKWYGGDYVWGGTKLGEGVDCSGYVMQVYKHFKIALPRLSQEQAGVGKAITSVEDALPGDLMFYTGTHDGVGTTGVGHVAIYIGNRKIIHAASETRGIVCDDFDYLESPMVIRRVIDD